MSVLSTALTKDGQSETASCGQHQLRSCNAPGLPLARSLAEIPWPGQGCQQFCVSQGSIHTSQPGCTEPFMKAT